MARLPWTKFQDFYLRLGFLKVLAATLSPQRRSVTNDAIILRLERPLFDLAWRYPDLWQRVSEHFPPSEFSHSEATRGKERKDPSVAEALLIDGMCPSLLFAITGPTAYKIVDWARNVQFIGRGNQISERCLLLRYLIDDGEMVKFLGGDVRSWNPFILDESEQRFLLYHLVEIDEVMLELIQDIGFLEEGSILESSDAARMTCRALIRVLTKAKNSVQPRDILAFRTACELAGTIADELGLSDLARELGGRPRSRIPKVVKPTARRLLTKTGTLRPPRRTTKNADHQTIPRFEQLVDLGFLEKPIDESRSAADPIASRKRWRYRPTKASHRWAAARKKETATLESFLWEDFARTCLVTAGSEPSTLTKPSASVIARYLWNSYVHVRRPAGYDPLDSVALLAMLAAVRDGVRIEMGDFHRLMLAIKQQSMFPEHAFFASGNELDRMFLLLKPGFLEQLEKRGSEISEARA